MRLAPVIVLLAAALGAARPAYALFEDDEARKRIDRLRSEVAENQRKVDERLKAIDAAVSSASDRSVLIDMSSQLEALRNEMARMRGQLEVLSNQSEVADRRQKDLYLDIDTRLRKLVSRRYPMKHHFQVSFQDLQMNSWQPGANVRSRR